MGTIPLWRSNVPGSKYEEVDEDSPLPTQLILGGLLTTPYNVYSLVIANTTNLQTIKGAPGYVIGWNIYNSSATVPLQVRLYNKVGLPVIASDASLIQIRIGVQASALGGSNLQAPELPGTLFTNGIGICAVTAAPGTLADTDAGAPAAGSALLNIYWL